MGGSRCPALYGPVNSRGGVGWRRFCSVSVCARCFSLLYTLYYFGAVYLTVTTSSRSFAPTSMVPRTTGCFSFSVSHYFGGILLAALLRCERASRVLTDLAAAWVVGHGFVYLQITFNFFSASNSGSSTGI